MEPTGLVGRRRDRRFHRRPAIARTLSLELPTRSNVPEMFMGGTGFEHPAKGLVLVGDPAPVRHQLARIVDSRLSIRNRTRSCRDGDADQPKASRGPK